MKLFWYENRFGKEENILEKKIWEPAVTRAIPVRDEFFQPRSLLRELCHRRQLVEWNLAPAQRLAGPVMSGVPRQQVRAAFSSGGAARSSGERLSARRAPAGTASVFQSTVKDGEVACKNQQTTSTHLSSLWTPDGKCAVVYGACPQHFGSGQHTALDPVSGFPKPWERRRRVRSLLLQAASWAPRATCQSLVSLVLLS